MESVASHKKLKTKADLEDKTIKGIVTETIELNFKECALSSHKPNK